MNAPLSPISVLPSGNHPAAAELRRFVAEIDALSNDHGIDATERQQRLHDLRTALEDGDSELRRRLDAHDIPARPVDHLIQARLRQTDGLRIATWGELLAHGGYAAAPLGRILLHWNGNRDTAAARPLEALCLALFTLERVLLSKQDYVEHDRIFLPQAYFRDAAIGVERLASASAQGQIRAALDRALDGVDQLLLESAAFRCADGSLRRHLARTLCATRRLARRARQGDPFDRPVELTGWDRFFCGIRAWWR